MSQSQVTKTLPQPVNSTNSQDGSYQMSKTESSSAHLLLTNPPPLPLAIQARLFSKSPVKGPLKHDYLTNERSNPCRVPNKVNVMLCIRQSNSSNEDRISGRDNSCLYVDPDTNMVTLTDHNASSSRRRRSSSSASSTQMKRAFAFDHVFTRNHSLRELCSTCLDDALYAVLNGQNSCILTLGHKKTGKTHTMLGSSDSSSLLGVIPCAISWLFDLLNRRKLNEGVQFTVALSAIEIFGPEETLYDLLSNTSMNVAGTDDHCSTTAKTITSNTTSSTNPDYMKSTRVSVTELPVTSSDKAAELLDVALGNCRSKHQPAHGLGHLFVTLNVVQYLTGTGDNNVTGSQEILEHASRETIRSKLHLIDFGHGRYSRQTNGSDLHHGDNEQLDFCLTDNPIDQSLSSRSKELVRRRSSSSSQADKCGRRSSLQLSPVNDTRKPLSLSEIVHSLMELLSGQQSGITFHQSKLTSLLNQTLSNSHPCILAHVSSSIRYLRETSQVLQLASKIDKLNLVRVGSSIDSSDPAHSSTGNTSDTTESQNSSSPDRPAKIRSRRPRLGRSSYARSIGSAASDFDAASMSEFSCPTVIHKDTHLLNHLRPRGVADGSVHITGRSECSDSETQILTQKPSSNSSKITKIELVKRRIPRTNATHWPRASVIRQRALEAMRSSEETWVDGPKSMETPISMNLNLRVDDANGTRSKILTIDPLLTTSFGTDVDSSNNSCQECCKSTGERKVNKHTNEDVNSIKNTFPYQLPALHGKNANEIQSANLNASFSLPSSLDYKHDTALSDFDAKQQQRQSQSALSDISECTEDTEAANENRKLLQTEFPSTASPSPMALPVSMDWLLVEGHCQLPKPNIPKKNIKLFENTEKAIQHLRQQIRQSTEEVVIDKEIGLIQTINAPNNDLTNQLATSNSSHCAMPAHQIEREISNMDMKANRKGSRKQKSSTNSQMDSQYAVDQHSLSDKRLPNPVANQNDASNSLPCHTSSDALLRVAAWVNSIAPIAQRRRSTTNKPLVAPRRDSLPANNLFRSQQDQLASNSICHLDQLEGRSRRRGSAKLMRKKRTTLTKQPTMESRAGNQMLDYCYQTNPTYMAENPSPTLQCHNYQPTVYDQNLESSLANVPEEESSEKKSPFRRLRLTSLPLIGGLISRYKTSRKSTTTFAVPVRTRYRSFSGDRAGQPLNTVRQELVGPCCPTQQRHATTPEPPHRNGSHYLRHPITASDNRPSPLPAGADWCNLSLCSSSRGSPYRATPSPHPSIAWPTNDWDSSTGQGQTLNHQMLTTIDGFSGALLPSSFYRGGRRSGTGGGPSSSGYESMPVATSDLSLSHHDSTGSELSDPQLLLSSFGQRKPRQQEEVKSTPYSPPANSSINRHRQGRSNDAVKQIANCSQQPKQPSYQVNRATSQSPA